MNFLYPGFLFALFAVAIPIVIHLFNFRKFKKIYFSNVRLLKEVKQQNLSREQLKNVLILFSRILAIIFLVLAFAQPYLPLNDQKTKNLTNNVSIYIDNSYSMEAINSDGNLLDEAKRNAKDLVKHFGINDRFQLLTNDFEGRYQRLITEEEFLKALDDVSISPAQRNVQQIINRQASILSGAANQYSFIISDFQNNILANKKLQTNPDIQYSFLKLKSIILPNVALDSVWSLSPSHQAGVSEKLVVQLKNYSEKDAENVPLKLTLNNQQKGLSSINVPAGKIIRDTLSFSGLKMGWQKGIVTIKDFPVTFDDTLSFSFKVDQNLPILSINRIDNGGYIKALFAVDKYYKLTENLESNINFNSFHNYSLIVLNGLKNPSTGLAQQLSAYLNAGGSVMLFPDLDADIQVYNSFLSALSLPVIQKLNTIGTKVDRIDLQHPIFKTVFENIPKNLDLPSVKRYFSFAQRNAGNKESIMQFADGQAFFASYGIGNGKLYLSASGLNATDGNLALHPIFVPLLYRIALNSGTESSLYYHPGIDNALISKKITLGKNQTLRLIANNFDAIPEIRQANGKTLIYVADQIKTPGFYSLKLADSLLEVYSFNIGRSESDMHYLSKNQLESLAQKSSLKIFDTDKDAITVIAGANKIGHTLWKLCLILSLISIAAEILLIRFFNKPKKTP